MKRPLRGLSLFMFLALFAGLHLLPAPVARADNTFTIAVIPDTQNYVDNNKPQPDTSLEFNAETQYLADNASALNLVFVTHVGDVVQHGDGTNGTPGNAAYGAGAQWVRAQAAMQILANANIPFGVSIGNHDYDNFMYTGTIPSRPLMQVNNMFRQYFGSGSSFFKGKLWYGGASDNLAYNPGLSSYQTFQAGGKNFLHISLELEASDAALQWAQNVIYAYPGYATIVTTHSYISPFPAGDTELPVTQGGTNNAPYNAADNLTTSGNCTGQPQTTTSPGGCNAAQAVFNKLIAMNDQIFLVICGHSFNPTVHGISQAEAIRVDYNNASHPVYQVLTDYQGNTTNPDGSAPYVDTNGIVHMDPGGGGWIRLMQFNMDAGWIHFSTYSPVMNSGNGKNAGLSGETTFNQPALFSDFFEVPMPIQVLNATSFALPGHPRILGPGLSALAPILRK